MRQLILLGCAILVSSLTSAQATFRTTSEKPIQKYRTLDLGTLQEPQAYVEFLERPRPGGDAYHRMLHDQKTKASALFPESPAAPNPLRSSVEPPILLRNFFANTATGIPLDNHLAVNRQDQVVSVINTHMCIVGGNGTFQKQYSLDDFWSAVGETELYFDPRIIYDPIEDRYILTMMQDFDCEGSNIVFAFSATNDPTGAWHMYRFEGCPNADATFADYPMISITDTELFYTYNAVYEDSSWQTGFNQTLIYQINKHDGYAGEDLQWRSWSDIRHEGRLIRYMCPVKYATEFFAPEMYFLSSRSFDVQNDTFFLLHINGNQDHPGLELTIQPLISDLPYGVPPNARQPMDFLQTNDARVLDAFIVDDHIQFVNSTMDPGTGRSAVYHGIIDAVSSSPTLSGQYLHNGSEHFAYPGIAYTGALAGERDAIIIASHASATRFPGYSALYYNEGYSDWVVVKEGLRNINMFDINNPFGVDPTLERWGDYSGIQRQYNEIGTVYTASSYGKPGSVNDTWIGYLSRPDGKPSSSQDITSNDAVNAFPNPTHTYFTVDVNTDMEGKTLKADLYDVSGNLITTVFDQKVVHEGALRFHYNTAPLTPGTYVLHVMVDGKRFSSQRIVVQ